MNKDRFNPCLRHMAAGMLLVTIATVLTALLHESWIVRKVEQSNLAALETLLPQKADGQVVVVEISDDDYVQMFGASSPLKPEKVAELINAIDAGGAAAIGVDIDDSRWTEEQKKLIHSQAPVVWAQWNEREGEPGSQAQEKDDGAHAPAFLVSVDGVAHGYHRYLPSQNGARPSFTTLLLRRAHRLGEEKDRPTEEQVLPFEASGDQLQTRDAGTLSLDGDASRMRQARPFADRIVLLGGNFASGRDRHMTPIGEMQGVEVMANILQAELGGRHIKPAGRFAFILADLLVGLLLIAIEWKLSQRHRSWTLLTMLVVTPLCAAAFSVAAFAIWRYYFCFLPVIIGVLLHTLLDNALELYRLRAEVDGMKRARARRMRCLAGYQPKGIRTGP
jgi:CHASE2 domain-containing sensor protein